MREVIMTSNSGDYTLVKKSGVGAGDRPWEGLEVRSSGNADKHVVEIRLDSDNFMTNIKSNEPFKYTYNDVHIAHGMRSCKDTIQETKEYIEVLTEAIEFAGIVKEYIKNSEWSA